ncbi:MAG TPA: tripartite tricarboxylate transporter TctB family protein, partial [Stellaceae bacterium]|nr:tripartite tricarboxylate transporter TctB family protein [Stellaceae bacterium]
LRAIYLIPLAVVFFALTVERFGLVIAIIGTSIIACLANPTIRIVELAVMSVALAIFGAVVFVYGLNLPLSLWPG